MRKLRIAILIVMGWYLFLATIHYFNQRPLWNDEYCVFINFKEIPLKSLFWQQLSHAQEFPRVYLYMIGSLAHCFHDHLLALRFFPFLCMVLAFLIWVHLIQKQVKSSVGILTYVLCWSASVPLIYYAAELKQYSMDVLIGSIFSLFLYYQNYLKARFLGWRYAFILFMLACSGLFSYPSFFFMPLPLFNLWRDARERTCSWFYVWFYLIGCLMCLFCVYYFDFRYGNSSALISLWKNNFLDFSSLTTFFRSFQETINNIVSHWFAERPRWIRVVARIFIGLGLIRLILGFSRSFKEDGFRFKSLGTIAGIMFWEQLLLSALKKYSFGVPRMSLFFAPLLLWSTIDALQWIKERNKPLYMVFQIPFVIFLVYVSLGIAGIIFKGDLGAEPVIWQ